ncbi:MAG: hypothetical protein JXB07_04640 [Anaerolineae bacterium]|nr:hypothetical protein [Anaerolineae bacterium]
MPSKKKLDIGVWVLAAFGIIVVASFWSIVSPSKETLLVALGLSAPSSLDRLKTTTITIQDNWMGMSPASPIKAHYVLTQGDGHFDGQADFSVGGRERKLTASRRVTISQEAVASFLEVLADSELGNWRFDCIIADDYPDISITVSSNAGTVKFHTTSSCEDYIPWTIEIDGRPYITNSHNPAQALRQLKLFMAPGTLENLIQQAKW